VQKDVTVEDSQLLLLEQVDPDDPA